MTRVLVLGSRGKVGARVTEGVRAAADLELAGQVEVGDDLAAAIARGRPQVGVDFTTPEAVFGNARTLLGTGVHAVIGTTGLAEAQMEALDALARGKGLSCLVAPNFAVGAVLLMRFAEEAARHFAWVEIVERHHEQKLDAPSGTARLTAERIARARGKAPAPPRESESAPGARGGRVAGVPVHSIRLPGSIAHQEVWFGGPGETLVLRHDATDRAVYVPGVLLAVRRAGSFVGLRRGLEAVLWPDG
ncbi:MAG: 4-hydroxy-tetrahydrodipicolinate reductase [Planctomycetaceae bacterium]